MKLIIATFTGSIVFYLLAILFSSWSLITFQTSPQFLVALIYVSGAMSIAYAIIGCWYLKLLFLTPSSVDHRCPNLDCHYDLRGAEIKCPECGETCTLNQTF